MLAQRGGPPLDGAGCPSQAHLDSRLFHPAVLGVIDFCDDLPGDGMLVDQPFVDGFADGADTVGLGDGVLPFLGGPLHEHLLEPVLPHCDCLWRNFRAVEVFQVFDPLGTVGGGHQLAHEPLIHAVGLEVAAVGTHVLMGHDVPGQVEQVGRVDVV